MHIKTLGRTASVALALVVLLGAPAIADDASMLREVEERFARAGLGEDADITVTVQDEIVHLKGIALSLRDARRAEREARKVSKIVINEIHVFPENVRPDQAIRQDAERAVYTYARYGVFDAVGLSVDEGVVTLVGFVNDDVRREDLEERIARIDGVRDVHNDLRLQGRSPYDERLRLQLYARIYNDPLFSQYASWPEPPVRVFVDRGRVTLAGTVNSRVEQARLGLIAGESLAFSVQNAVRLESDRPREDAPRDDG